MSALQACGVVTITDNESEKKPNKELKGIIMETRELKIAFATDDGNTISPHFGRAQYFEVVTVANGAVTNRERREKAGHHTFASVEGHQHHHGDGHGHDEGARQRHTQIVSGITDCQIVVARGMGMGAYDHLTAAKITPILTANHTIDEAVREIVSGAIVNHAERLH
jgi:predicted Fe-Mo cluster-binding NifX family protein